MKAQFICDCVDYTEIFNNATEMAQAVENAKTISKKDFYNMVEIMSPHKKIKQPEYSKNKNLLILYDTIKDIHYFYLLKWYNYTE